MALEPQAALETALRDLIRSKLGYQDSQCDRVGFEGMPPPRCGQIFVAVWSDNARENQTRTALDELFGVYVTVTRRVQLPFDRHVRHRDELEQRVNAIRALAAQGTWNWAVMNAANTLAGYDSPATRPVGFRGALAFEGLEPIRVVGGDWFSAAGEKQAGLAQTIRLGRARHIQALPTAT